jgi:hypothetical protein
MKRKSECNTYVWFSAERNDIDSNICNDISIRRKSLLKLVVAVVVTTAAVAGGGEGVFGDDDELPIYIIIS